MIEFALGFAAGVVGAVLLSKFMPAKWKKVQDDVGEKINDLTGKDD